MLLGFKKRFAALVDEGSKTHTIRAARKNPPRVGETCHCYTGLRQKGARLLGRWRCSRVQEIDIEWLAVADGMTLLITIDGVQLSRDEANLFAFRDGFRTNGISGALDEMHAYWHELHGSDAFPFSGHLIHWSFSNAVATNRA